MATRVIAHLRGAYRADAALRVPPIDKIPPHLPLVSTFHMVGARGDAVSGFDHTPAIELAAEGVYGIGFLVADGAEITLLTLRAVCAALAVRRKPITDVHVMAEYRHEALAWHYAVLARCVEADE